MSKFWEFQNVTNSSAEILVYGPIITDKPWWAEDGDGFAVQNEFIKDLEALGTKDEITVRINSTGGEVFAATAMASHLKENSAKIIAIIDGVAASAATIISSAADVVKMDNGGLFMVHDPLLMLFGRYNEQELNSVQNALKAVKKAIVNGYKTKTGLSDDELSDIMSKETWMTAEEAVELGFVDIVLHDTNISNSISNDAKHLFYNSVDHDITNFKDFPLSKFQNLAKPTPAPKNQEPAVKPVVVPDNKIPEGGNVEMTLAELKAKHPELYNEIVNSTLEGERERMEGIDAISNTMSADMVKEAKYVNFASPQELAFNAIVEASKKGKNYLNDVADDLNPQDNAGAGEGGTEEPVVAPVPAKPVDNVEPKTGAQAVKEKVMNANSKYERTNKKGAE